jgi:hypothetical protein
MDQFDPCKFGPWGRRRKCNRNGCVRHPPAVWEKIVIDFGVFNVVGDGV